MNLSGVGTDEIRRGDVVIKPDTINGSLLIDVALSAAGRCAQSPGAQHSRRFLQWRHRSAGAGPACWGQKNWNPARRAGCSFSLSNR
ncbi:MAG: hypothetical protein R2911_16675 [Caldilineaceae bacterium]